MRVAIDLDGVVCDFNTAFLRTLTETSGRALALPDPRTKRYAPETWHWAKDLGYTSKEVSAAWDAVSESDYWWVDLLPLPGAVEFLRQLSDWRFDSPHNETYFVTSRQRKSRWVKQQCEDWLTNRGYDGDPTVITDIPHKGDLCAAMRVDLLLDDKPSHLSEALAACGAKQITAVLRAQPWNIGEKLAPEIEVAQSLEDVWRWVK